MTEKDGEDEEEKRKREEKEKAEEEEEKRKAEEEEEKKRKEKEKKEAEEAEAARIKKLKQKKPSIFTKIIKKIKDWRAARKFVDNVFADLENLFYILSKFIYHSKWVEFNSLKNIFINVIKIFYG